MSKIIHIGSKIELLHDNDQALYHAELLRLIEEHMGMEFHDLIADELDELATALRDAEDAEDRVRELESEIDDLRAELETLKEDL